MAISTSRESAGEHPVILFDGNCGLCDRWVSFVIKADRRAHFRFAPLRPEDLARAESVMLRENGRLYLRSDAVLRVFSLLGFPYSLAAPLRFLPLALRDAVYNWVARNRYRWFGHADACRIPTAEERARFVA